MADDITLDDLMAKQKAMSALAEQMVGETDVERIQQVAAELQTLASELQAMGESLASKSGVNAAANWTEVVLTPAQRQRVQEKTGIALETIKLRDPAGVAARTMPNTDPRIVEYYATQEALRRKSAAEADAMVEEQLTASLEAIESQGTPAVLEELEKLKQDPSFVGGLMQKGK